MKLGTKIKLLSLATSVLLFSGYLVKIIPFRIFIGVIIIYLYYYFIFRIKTIVNENKIEVCYVKDEIGGN